MNPRERFEGLVLMAVGAALGVNSAIGLINTVLVRREYAEADNLGLLAGGMMLAAVMVIWGSTMGPRDVD